MNTFSFSKKPNRAGYEEDLIVNGTHRNRAFREKTSMWVWIKLAQGTDINEHYTGPWSYLKDGVCLTDCMACELLKSTVSHVAAIAKMYLVVYVRYTV
jgi:hypothetical protein